MNINQWISAFSIVLNRSWLGFMLKESHSPLTSLRGVHRGWFTTLVLFYCLIVHSAGTGSYLVPLRKTCSGSFCIHGKAWGGSAGVFGVCACGVRCPGLNRPPQNMLYELMRCALVLGDNINLRVSVRAHVNQFCLGLRMRASKRHIFEYFCPESACDASVKVIWFFVLHRCNGHQLCVF